MLLLLAVVVFSSRPMKVLSQHPDDSSSYRVPTKNGVFSRSSAEDFMPDSLASDEDDSEHQVQRGSHAIAKGGRIVRLMAEKRAKQSRRGNAQTAASRQGKMSRNATPGMNVRAVSKLNNQNIAPESQRPKRSLASNYQPASTDVKTPRQSTAGQKQSGAVSEEKLKMTTRKLVKWLRNRLRKRLEDVVSLEEKCDIEQKLLIGVNKTIEYQALERRAEINVKLKTQSEIQNIRQHMNGLELRLQEVRSQNANLVEQLSHLKEVHNQLEGIRKKLEDKLISTGITNWLEKRGPNYMPATAAGVLSKSAKILDPVSRGLEEVIKLDELFSSGVESVVPIPKRSLLSEVIRDLALVLPVIPVIMLFWRIGQISQRLSVLHLVLYISAILAIESGFMFVLSICTGTEAVLELQKSYELLLATAVFIDIFLLFSMILLQVLVTTLRPSGSELMQAMLGLALGYHFFKAVFQPVALSKSPTVTTPALFMYSISFAVICFEKKATLRLGTRLDKHLNSVLLIVEGWVSETWEAMKNLFVDTIPDISDCDDEESSFEGRSLSREAEVNRDLVHLNNRVPFSGKVDVDIEEVTNALNGSLDYARWSGRKTNDKSSQRKQKYRGIWSYKADAQSRELHSIDKTA